MQTQPLTTLAPEFNNQYLVAPVAPLARPCPGQCPKPAPAPCPKPCPAPCPKPCPDPCDPCVQQRHGYHSWGMGWGGLGALVLWFIIFIVLFWLIFYSLKPSWVLQNGTNQVDTAKVLLSAVIAALILIVIIWLIKLAIDKCGGC